MPELPEVETTKEGIRPHLEGQVIDTITVRNPNLRRPIPLNINELCTRKQIIAIKRRAKYLLIHLTEGCLLIHLGMSGHLRIVPNPTLPKKHDHVDINLGNHATLRYCDPRRFGLVHYIDEDPYLHPLLSHLGPEPLSAAFNSDYLYQKIQSRQQAIKSLIMHNEIVVGVGNIYATESLFLAKIHPQTAAKNISYEQCALLTQYIKNTLLAAIEAGGTTLKDFYTFDGTPGYFNISLHVYGRKKQACVNCKQIIETVIIAGRHSAFCPNCQPLYP